MGNLLRWIVAFLIFIIGTALEFLGAPGSAIEEVWPLF
jgi:hypothetical protein